MKVLNILGTGTIGGIEKLCKDIAASADYDNTFVFLFSEGVVYYEMKAAGFNVISLAEYGTKKVKMSRINALKKIAADYDIIVVHHSAFAIHLYYNILKFLIPSKKFVFTAHSCFEPTEKHTSGFSKDRVHYFLIKRILKFSDLLIFVSNSGKKSYTDHFKIDDTKTAVVYNGIFMPENYSADDHSEYTSDKLRLTYIGRLVEVKGVHKLIDAVGILRKSGINAELKICGDGDYRSSLENKVNELGLSKCISFEGVQRNIAAYHKNTDIFVYPSVWEEVFGISLVEAMSYGVPCAAFKVGGIPEILKDGVNGALAEEKTPEALSSAIMRIAGMYNEGNIAQLRANCLETAERFSIESTVDSLKKCFEKISRE